MGRTTTSNCQLTLPHKPGLFARQMLKRHGPFVALYFYCKIMLYGINCTYCSVKTVKICFHLPFRG